MTSVLDRYWFGIGAKRGKVPLGWVGFSGKVGKIHVMYIIEQNITAAVLQGKPVEFS